MRMSPALEPGAPLHVADNTFRDALEARQTGSWSNPLAADYHIAQAKVRQRQESIAQATESTPGNDVTITTLGTGSAMPSKYRNGKPTIILFATLFTDRSSPPVSGTIIQIPNHGSILLDCGEGTWGQMVRHFGPDAFSNQGGVNDVLRDLKCIFVSHIHGDHHMGLAKILARRRAVGVCVFCLHRDVLTVFEA